MDEDKDVVNRTAKDTVFTHLFRDKEYVLELYKALHPEAEGVTEDMIDIVTLENILVDAMYNDLGFIVNDQMVILVEAQSTWSENIILRVLMYLCQTYQDYITKHELNIYSSKKLSIPIPELYVVYTGEKKIEEKTITLSKEFFGGQKTGLEVEVHVLTDGRKGDILYQYVAFTKVLNEQIGKYGRKPEAVWETIRICKDRDILKKFLSEHEGEVDRIMGSLFSDEQIFRAFGKEKIAEGIEQGIEQGREEGKKEGQNEGKFSLMLKIFLKQLSKGASFDEAADTAGAETPEEIEYLRGHMPA